MKQPKSELPWKLKTDFNSWVGRTYEILNKNGEYFCHDEGYYDLAPSKEDAEYIVEACNNYQKAVELIEFFVKKVELGRAKSSETYNMYKEFLNNIK